MRIFWRRASLSLVRMLGGEESSEAPALNESDSEALAVSDAVALVTRVARNNSDDDVPPTDCCSGPTSASAAPYRSVLVQPMRMLTPLRYDHGTLPSSLSE